MKIHHRNAGQQTKLRDLGKFGSYTAVSRDADADTFTLRFLGESSDAAREQAISIELNREEAECLHGRLRTRLYEPVPVPVIQGGTGAEPWLLGWKLSGQKFDGVLSGDVLRGYVSGCIARATGEPTDHGAAMDAWMASR